MPFSVGVPDAPPALAGGILNRVLALASSTTVEHESRLFVRPRAGGRNLLIGESQHDGDEVAERNRRRELALRDTALDRHGSLDRPASGGEHVLARLVTSAIRMMVFCSKRP
jgi:hypothetical protein